MKIKRFFANDMRQAIRQVRQELGADAVILSNKSVEGGVEIIAARDYDERAVQQAVEEHQNAAVEAEPMVYSPSKSGPGNSPSRAAGGVQKPASRKSGIEWQEDPLLLEMKDEIRQLRREFRTQLNELSWADRARQNPLRMDVLRRLLHVGFSRKVSLKLVEAANAETRLEAAWQKCLETAAEALPVIDDPMLDQGGVIALVGPTGVGKTTTIAKLAARYRMRHGPQDLALVTTDNFRIGAQEQLSNFARILGVPMRVAATHQDLQQVLHGFFDKRLVLIDTAGMSQRDMRLTQQFSLLRNESLAIQNYLVLSATTDARALGEVIRAFAPAEPKACIVTKLDEVDCPGGVLSAIIEHQLPLSFMTDGQRVPEDIHLARANSLMGQFMQLDDIQQDEELSLSVLLGDSHRHATI